MEGIANRVAIVVMKKYLMVEYLVNGVMGYKTPTIIFLILITVSPAGFATGSPVTVTTDQNDTDASVVPSEMTGSHTTSRTEATVSFREAQYVEQRGDVVEITVELTDTDTATITATNGLDEEPLNYDANITVRDRNGDGVVRLRFNTYLGADGVTAWQATSEDVIVDSSFTALPSRLPPATTYDLSVRPGEDGGGLATDLVSLTIEPLEIEHLRLWTVPEDQSIDSYNRLYDVLGVSVTETDRVALDDKLMIQIVAPGLEGLLAPQGSPGRETDQSTTRFLNAIQQGETPLDLIVRTNSGFVTDNHENLDGSNTAVLADTGYDSYYIIVDTSEVTLASGGVGAETTLEFGIDESASRFTGERASVSDSYELVQPAVEIPEPNVVRTEEAAITGTTTLAPGTEMQVRVESRETPAFLITRETRVEDDGTFTIRLDASDWRLGREYEVTARVPERVSASASGVVEELTPTWTSPTRTATRTPTRTATRIPTPDVDARDLRFISYGETRDGEIDQRDPSGYYGHYEPVRFEGTAGGVVTITMRSDGDPRLLLLDPSGSVVAENDDADGVGELNSQITRFQLSRDGVYTIVATTYTEGRLIQYRLGVEENSPPQATTPTPTEVFTPTPAATPTFRPTPTEVFTPTPTATPTFRPTSTDSPTPTFIPSPTDSSTPTATPTREDTNTPLQDSDGDGVIDEEDYAPSDPEVQEKSDLQGGTGIGTTGFGFLLSCVALTITLWISWRKKS